MKCRRIYGVLLCLAACVSLVSAFYIGIDNDWCSVRCHRGLRNTSFEYILCVVEEKRTNGFHIQLSLSRDAPFVGLWAYKGDDCFIGLGQPSKNRTGIGLIGLLAGSIAFFAGRAVLRIRQSSLAHQCPEPVDGGVTSKTEKVVVVRPV